MAKKTKAASLTIEEKLEQALVVPGYEPYKIPDNWCWLKLLASFDNCTDSKKKIQQKKYLKDGAWTIIDQGKQEVGGYTNDEALLYSGILPVIIFGDHTRCIKYIDFPFAQGADGVKVLRPKSFYSPKLFYYALQSVEIPNLGYRRHFPIFDRFAIPLPPLSEQQRIVERIESLFSKLDEAKEKAQEVIDSFEIRKAAILHKAFSGELTAKWREENGVGIESWERKRISECCKLGSGGTPSRKKPNYYTGDIPWIKTGEINWNTVNYSEESITQEAIDNSSTKVYAPGAVLVAMYGMGITRGKAAILGIEAATNQAVCVLQPKGYLFNRYLYFFFMCNYWDIREQAVGGNQLNLSATIIGKLNIDIPNLEEQYVITELLDSIIEKEYQTKQIAESVIDQIDAMKKAILARAFRGELGTNDPEEESAVELLKQILSGE